MKLRFLSLHLLTLASLCARDFRPESHSENITLPDTSIQECSVFTSIAGVGYTIESSTDLTQWSTQDAFYGTGGQHVVTLRQFKAPPPAPPGTPPVATGPQAINASLWIQRSTGGGTLLSWPSLDQDGPMVYKISAEMAAGWNTATGYVEHYGNYEFYLSHPFFAAATPPAVNPPLGPLDSAMLAVFEANFAAMNAQVTAPSVPQRNVPATGSSTALPVKFLRIKVDPTLDTDADGSPDWAEFQISQNPNTPTTGSGGASGNPFDSDTNHDGIPDGDQLDTDQDGTPDAKDPDPSDDTNFFPLGSIPRYAFFPIENVDNTDTFSLWSHILQINDKGRVLYQNGTWSAGIWTPLQASAIGGGYGVTAYAINDNDTIIGQGYYKVRDNPEYIIDVLHYWNTPQAIPLPIHKTSDINQAYAGRFGHPYLAAHDHTRKTFLSNDGTFTAITRQWIANPDGEFFEKFLHFSTWNLPTSTGSLCTEAVNAGKMQYHRSPGLSWNFDPDRTAAGKVFTPDALPDLPFVANQVYTTPNGILALPDSYLAPTPRLYNHGIWKDAKLYQNTEDMSADGTAIKRSCDGLVAPILLNARWTEISRSAPGLPDFWLDSSVWLSNTTSNGWILAQRYPMMRTNKAAAMLPIKVDGVNTNVTPADQEYLASGVDRVSMTADVGSGGTVPEIWIMAPNGGASTTARFRTPVSANSKLTLAPKVGTSNISFSPTVLDQRDMQIQVRGNPLATAATEDVTPDLILGDSLKSLSIPLKIKTMKKRLVKLAVHPVASVVSGRPNDPPDFMPTQSELTLKLNEIYGKQINAFFAVTILPQENIAFDVANSTSTFPGATFSNAALPVPGDRKLQFKGWDIPEVGAITTNRSGDYDIHVYIFGGASPIIQFQASPSNPLMQTVGSTPLGIANVLPGQNYCIVDGDRNERQKDLNGNPTYIFTMKAGYRSTLSVMNTIAHEIGHIIVASGHPDQGDLPAPLPGTDLKKRLMYSQQASEPPNRQQLVKAEWDAAEVWLSSNVDTRKP